MPIYEYHCNNCGHEFEVIQKFNDKPIKKCEKCGELQAKRMISQTSFILKGSGWYVTDYKGKKPSDTNGSPAKKSEDQTKSGGDTSDSPPKKTPETSKKAANA